MRRLNRTGAREDAAFPAIVSKSPLIAGSQYQQPYLREKIIRGVHSTFIPAVSAAPTMRRCAEDAVLEPSKVDVTTKLPISLLAKMMQFFGDTPRDAAILQAVCNRWRHASFSIVESVTVYPDCSPDTKNVERSIASLNLFFSPSTRGDYLRSITLVDSHKIISLPQSLRGPEISARHLFTLLRPNLTFLDVRGVYLREFSAACDVFLSSIHMHSPCLRTLKVGAQLIRNWENQWWMRLPYLSELVVGSRREDADWHSGTLLHLPDDFFVMLRSPAHTWSALKVWPPLTPASFTAIVGPQLPFPRLCHVSINALGNCNIRPLEEPVLESNKDEKRRPNEKASKKAAAQEDHTHQKGLFPQLLSVTVADVMERPEFGVELLARLALQAPQLKNFSVANTLRNAPTKAEALIVKGKKTRRAQ